MRYYRLPFRFTELYVGSASALKRHTGIRLLWMLAACALGQAAFFVFPRLPACAEGVFYPGTFLLAVFFLAGTYGALEFSLDRGPGGTRAFLSFGAFYFFRFLFLETVKLFAIGALIFTGVELGEARSALIAVSTAAVTAGLAAWAAFFYAGGVLVTDNVFPFGALRKSMRIARDNPWLTLKLCAVLQWLPLAAFAGLYYLGSLLPPPADSILSALGTLIAAWFFLVSTGAALSCARRRRRRREEDRGEYYPFKGS